MYNVKKITSHKLIHRLLRDKLPRELNHIISKYVGKYFRVNIPKKWVRLKLPREKRLIKVYY